MSRRVRLNVYSYCIKERLFVNELNVACKPETACRLTSLPEFDFRMYRVKELAVLYFPSVANATRSLSALIRRDPLLLTDLEHAGYGRGIRYLSPEMVRIIVHYLGTPAEFVSLMHPDAG